VTTASRRYVVHPSVIAQLWQYPSQLHDAAQRWLQDLASGDTHVAAVEGIEQRVLVRLLQHYRDIRLEPFVSLPLFMDVKSQHGFMELVPANQLDASAFVLASKHGLSFDDALSITLAEGEGIPLLIADEGVLKQLEAVQEERDLLQLAWLLNS